MEATRDGSRPPELLAPAGTWDALVAAVERGADAVYLGGKAFNARQFAGNLDDEEMKRAAEYAHLRGVRLYVTVNTLVADSELEELAGYLRYLYEIGIDAVIVQDLGVLKLARQLFPALEVHASTQMTVHNAAGARLLEHLGIDRIVLARELSLEEIAAIKAQTRVGLEVFIHGALCFSYSGQCLMSSLIGGRSGNRGRCAQPCRMEYSLARIERGDEAGPAPAAAHLLSPRDLKTIELLPRLIEAGIAAFKIEGRMKRPEYVATVVRIYREAIDRYLERPQEYAVREIEHKQLAQIFNREFTSGYFLGNPGRDLMSYQRPNNRGLFLGRVVAYDRGTGRVEIRLEEPLQVGDGIEVWVSRGGRAGATVSRLWRGGQPVDDALPGDTVAVAIEGDIHTGDRAFKTHDTVLVAEAERAYRSPRPLRRVAVTGRVHGVLDQPLRLWLADSEGNKAEARTSVAAQEAINRPLTPEVVTDKLSRLGNTPYELANLKIELEKGIMVPLSELNELRRQAVEELSRKRLARFHREPVIDYDRRLVRAFRLPGEEARGEQPMLAVRAAALDVIKAAARNGADFIYIQADGNTDELSRMLDWCGSQGIPAGIASPRITREPEMGDFARQMERLLDYDVAALLAGNLGLFFLGLEEWEVPVHADFTLNPFNSQALNLLADLGAAQVCLSPEMTFEQIRGLTRPPGVTLEALVQGSLPLMVSEHCVLGSVLGGRRGGRSCSRPCRAGRYGLVDRLGVTFPIEIDRRCRMHIYNSVELCMIEHLEEFFAAGIDVLRIEATRHEAPTVAGLVNRWRRALDAAWDEPEGYRPAEARADIERLCPHGVTKGHYFRGIL